MATIAEVSRGLNEVRTAGQAKVAIGEALSEIGRAYNFYPKITTEQARALDRARLPLELWFAEIKNLPDSTDYKSRFYLQRDQVTRAYVETAGILGEISARGSVSFWKEVGTGFKELPHDVGVAAGQLAGGVGETAGSLIGGLFSGLGPVVVIILALVIYFQFFKGKK